MPILFTFVINLSYSFLTTSFLTTLFNLLKSIRTVFNLSNDAIEILPLVTDKTIKDLLE